MPIQFDCENCQKKLKVPESAAGKKGRCNECGHLNTIPADSSAETSLGGESVINGDPLTTQPTGTETYSVKSAVNGAVFGPADSATLKQWLDEGRITPNCQLQQTGSDAWTMASQMFPSLGGAVAATAGANDQFAQFQQSAEAPSNPNELNPYASSPIPHASAGPEVRREIVPTSGNIEFAISHGWKTWTENFGIMLAVFATLVGVNYATQILQQVMIVGLAAAGNKWIIGAAVVVSTLISIGTQMWLTLGFIKVTCQLCRGERTEYATLFRSANRLPLALLLVFLVYLPFIVIGGGLLLFVGPDGFRFGDEAGVAVLITVIGGVILSMLFGLVVWPIFFLLADTKLRLAEMISKGCSIGVKNCLIVIPIFFVAFLAMMMGIVACGVGVIATIPAGYAIVATAYLNMSGQLRPQ